MKNTISDAFEIHWRILAGETVLVRTKNGDYYRISLGKHTYVSVFDIIALIEGRAYSDKINYELVSPSSFEELKHYFTTIFLRANLFLRSFKYE